MRDLLIQCAGGLAIAIALAHGMIGEMKIFAGPAVTSERFRLLLRLVWQASTVAWVGLGVLLIAVPTMGSDSARHWIAAISAAILLFGAMANAWGTRGRNLGWLGLVVAAGLAVAGW